MVTAVLTSPLDVLKTRLQSDFYQSQLKKTNPNLSMYKSSLLHFRETFGILFSIHRLEGWRGLFKGLGPSLTGVVPATAIKFYAYGNCKTLFPQILGCEENTTLVHALSAATAGIVTGTATNPIWLVKTRLQLDKSRVREVGSSGVPQYKNSFDCVKQVIRQEGVRGLYRGLAASYLGVIETTLHLAMYERMKGFLAKQNSDNQATQGIALSAAAGFSKLLAVLIAYPHEVRLTLPHNYQLMHKRPSLTDLSTQVVRTRLRQAPMENGRFKYTGVVQCLRLVWREEGMVAIYGGLTAHLLRTVPAAMITLGTYELVLNLLSQSS